MPRKDDAAPLSTDDKKRTENPPIERFEELIRAVYQGRFKRANVTKAELASLSNSAPLTDADRDDLLELAESDRLLDRTRQLMLLGIRISAPGPSGLLREFGRDALARHPSFEAETLQAVLSNLPDALADDKAISQVLSTDCSSLKWRVEGAALTRKQSEQCRTNAAHCLLLLFWGARGTSLDRIHRLLQTNVWARAAAKAKNDVDKVHALLSSRDPQAASIVFGLLERELNEHKRRAEAARHSEERVSARLAFVEERLSTVEQELTQAGIENTRIQAEREKEEHAHAVAISHWKDDYEQLRGQVLRKLKDELALLDEGLHALRREPPKVHVMVDHAERAIDGLKREMERLRRKD